MQTARALQVSSHVRPGSDPGISFTFMIPVNACLLIWFILQTARASAASIRDVANSSDICVMEQAHPTAATEGIVEQHLD